MSQYANGKDESFGKPTAIRITRETLQKAVAEGWQAGENQLIAKILGLDTHYEVEISIFSGIRKDDSALIVGGRSQIAVISYRGMCRPFPRAAYEFVYPI